MPQGLQVYNAAGQLVLDIGSRPLKLLQVASITAGVPATIPTTGVVVPLVANSSLTYSPILVVNPTSVGVSWRPGSFGSADLMMYEF
jgi:hypothetical protein